MANQELIGNLNRALSLELAGVIQYMQHSFLVTGTEREVFARMVVEGHVRALAGEGLADGGAKAPRPARHERTLPFQKKTQGDSLHFDTHGREAKASMREIC